MAKTKAEIAQKVLEKLTVAESGTTADAADLTIVEDKYDSVYWTLAADDVVSWGSTDDIPTEAVNSIVSIVANDCLAEFIVPDRIVNIVGRDYIIGMNSLRKIEHIDYVPDEPEPHCF